MSTSRRTPTPSAFLNANQSGDRKPDGNIKFHVRFLLFPEALKNTSLLYSQTHHQIQSCTQIWLRNLILFTITMPLHKKIVCNRCRTEMHKNLSHDVCKRIHYIFHEKSQWSCSQHSLTKTENFAVFFCYAPLRAPSPSTYNKKMILPPLRRRGQQWQKRRLRPFVSLGISSSKQNRAVMCKG